MKKRIVSMDILRCISTLSVIMIHVTGIMMYSSNRLDLNIYKFSLILNQLSRFSVPAFIFLSGMGLSMFYKKKSNYFSYEFHRIKKILPQYIIWCILYSYFVIKKMNLKDMIVGIFNGDIYYHLYYIPIIIILYLLFPLCIRFFKSKKVVLLSFIITGAITVFNYINYNQGVWINYGRENFLNWVFYFVLGSNVGLNYKTYIKYLKKYNKIIFILLCIYIPIFMKESFMGIRSNVDHSTTFIRPTIVIFSVLVILLILGSGFKNNKFVKIISKNSYIIYLSHPLILYYIKKYFEDNSYNILSKKFLLLAYLNCIIGGILISVITNKLKKIYTKPTPIMKKQNSANFPV